jgi:hypothetical protein
MDDENKDAAHGSDKNRDGKPRQQDSEGGERDGNHHHHHYGSQHPQHCCKQLLMGWMGQRHRGPGMGEDEEGKGGTMRGMMMIRGRGREGQ